MVKTELEKGIYWVGAIDWNLRRFHGFRTQRGTTYNAYLIKDEKTALVDTVKAPYSKELVSKIKEITSFEKIDYIIINHLEMDHSGSFPIISKYAPNATIYCTERGRTGILKHYRGSWNFNTIKTGQQLNLGTKTLRFIEAPMLHWPDTMFTYIEEDKFLMSNDAFGQHFASSHRFDYQVDENVLMNEAKKYFANILMPFSSLIPKKIEELTQIQVAPKTIAPSHGVIWRTSPKKIVEAYLKWSEGLMESKAIIVYDSMWGSTDQMARLIAEGLSKHDITVELFKLSESDIAEIVSEILGAKMVIVGSPTLNNSIFPSVSSFLTYVAGLKPKEKLWAFFGSYGWGGGAVKKMMRIAEEANLNVFDQSLNIQYVPNSTEANNCIKFGEKLADQML